MKKGIGVASLAILPWLPVHLHGRQVPAPASARQVRLEAFRTTREQVRTCKREARKRRLELKEARLREALERARDRVQARLLHELHGRSKAPAPASGPSLRHGLLGLGGLCLLAGQAQAQGEVVAHFFGGPETEAPPQPAAPRPLPEVLTDLLMDQLDSDELENAGPMVQRALVAQRTLMRNALGTAIAFPLPASATPGAQLLQGAFQSALADTAQDFLGGVLPTEFGPLPPRRGAPPPAGDEREQALQAAKKDVVAAIREAKGVGSDIVVAATSLLGYGAFASVAYGLDIGASITGIFTSTPVSGAGIATGTLGAVANQFFLMAYASDAIAGAVLIHKLKEPYIDALLKVSDAEEAWVTAYRNYLDRNATGSSTGGSAADGAEAGGSGPGPAGSPGAAAPAGEPTGAIPPVPLTLVATAAGEPAAQVQTSAAAPRATPFRLGW